LLLAGCSTQVAEFQSVAELQSKAEELEGKLVQVTGEVQFVGESEMDRFLLRDPAGQAPAEILVRCSREDFAKVQKELSQREKNRLSIVATVYFVEAPSRKVQLQFARMPGGVLKWWLLTGMAVVGVAIGVVVLLLLRSPKREPDMMVYTEDDQETMRKYAQLKIFEDGQLQRMWYLAYDMNLVEPKITNVDIVIGTSGLLIGRDNPALGLVSQTYPRRVAVLAFRTDSREFQLTNVHPRRTFTVSDSKGGGTPTPLPPGKSCIMQNGYRLQVDESVVVQFERKEDPLLSGTTGRPRT
jgi:hypothetical protein